MKESIAILKSEHRSIAAVLHGLKDLARLAQAAKERPRFQVLRSMVRYIDEYPEKLHHPKEDDYLFARLLVPSAVGAPRLLVPSTAVFQRGGLNGLFVVAEGTARLRWV